jgi:hypothetical protein
MKEDTLTKSYQESLRERLRDPNKVMAYLNAALEEEDKELFLLALRNVADARQLPLPVTPLQWTDVTGLLNALGIQLRFDLKQAA